AKLLPPGAVWQVLQLPIAASSPPRRISAGSTLEASGGTMGSIGDRHANRKNAAMTAMQTATMTAMLRATIAHRWDAASLRRAEAPLAAFHVECVINAIQHAVALPPNEVVMDCAARRKILRKVAPLAASAQDIHNSIHDLAHVCSPLAAAALRWWNERFDKRPLVIRQVARVSQVIAIVFRSVLLRPHRRSLLE